MIHGLEVNALIVILFYREPFKTEGSCVWGTMCVDDGVKGGGGDKARAPAERGSQARAKEEEEEGV